MFVAVKLQVDFAIHLYSLQELLVVEPMVPDCNLSVPLVAWMAFAWPEAMHSLLEQQVQQVLVLLEQQVQQVLVLLALFVAFAIQDLMDYLEIDMHFVVVLC